MTPEESFWSHVDRRDDDQCWEWQGFRNEKRGGYGQGSFEGRQFIAHRMSWELSTGEPIPAGLYVRHGCDNPPCVNPAHLSLGTQRDNMQDAKSRGRMWFQRDQCKNGHELAGENVRWITKAGEPSRQCLACVRAMRGLRAERARIKYRREHNLDESKYRTA